LSLLDDKTDSGTMFRPDCAQYFLPASAGCAGGTISMGLVQDLLRLNPAKNALLVNIELCSLGVRPNRSGMSWLLNAGLFGDAIAATAFRGRKSAEDNLEKSSIFGLEMIHSLQRSVPNTSHVSGFLWDPEGYHFVTTQELVRVVEKNVPAFCKEVVKVSGFHDTDDIISIVHPGGAKMIDAMVGVIGPNCIRAARESLADGGNLASCSVLEILSRRWEAMRTGKSLNSSTNVNNDGNKSNSVNVVVVAMGPGFVMCGTGCRSWKPILSSN
jgi:alkylresorcinol/alkylpyrone synthase